MHVFPDNKNKRKQATEDKDNDQGTPNKKRNIVSPSKDARSSATNISKPTEKVQTDIPNVFGGDRIKIISCRIIREATTLGPSPALFTGLNTVSQQ